MHKIPNHKKFIFIFEKSANFSVLAKISQLPGIYIYIYISSLHR